jgi:hypothetical protein
VTTRGGATTGAVFVSFFTFARIMQTHSTLISAPSTKQKDK